MFLCTESQFHAHVYTANDSDIWEPAVSMGTLFTVIADNTFHLDVHYGCYVCSAFEPWDRRFTKFHYYHYYFLILWRVATEVQQAGFGVAIGGRDVLRFTFPFWGTCKEWSDRSTTTRASKPTCRVFCEQGTHPFQTLFDSVLFSQSDRARARVYA